MATSEIQSTDPLVRLYQVFQMAQQRFKEYSIEECRNYGGNLEDLYRLIAIYANLRTRQFRDQSTNNIYKEYYNQANNILNGLDIPQIRCLLRFMQMLVVKSHLQSKDLAILSQDALLAPSIRDFIFKEDCLKMTDDVKAAFVGQFLVDQKNFPFEKPAEGAENGFISQNLTWDQFERNWAKTCEILRATARLQEIVNILQTIPTRFLAKNAQQLSIYRIPVVASDGKHWDYQTLSQIYVNASKDQKSYLRPVVYVDQDMKDDISEWLRTHHFTLYEQTLSDNFIKIISQAGVSVRDDGPNTTVLHLDPVRNLLEKQAEELHAQAVRTSSIARIDYINDQLALSHQMQIVNSERALKGEPKVFNVSDSDTLEAEKINREVNKIIGPPPVSEFVEQLQQRQETNRLSSNAGLAREQIVQPIAPTVHEGSRHIASSSSQTRLVPVQSSNVTLAPPSTTVATVSLKRPSEGLPPPATRQALEGALPPPPPPIGGSTQPPLTVSLFRRNTTATNTNLPAQSSLSLPPPPPTSLSLPPPPPSFSLPPSQSTPSYSLTNVPVSSSMRVAPPPSNAATPSSAGVYRLNQQAPVNPFATNTGTLATIPTSSVPSASSSNTSTRVAHYNPFLSQGGVSPQSGPRIDEVDD